MNQTPETEREFWDAHTEPSEQYGGDWDDEACQREIVTGLWGARSLVLPTEQRVLELGCGTGRLLLSLAHTFPWVSWFGLDSSVEMVMTLEQAAREGGIPPNVHYQIGDGRSLPANHDFGEFDAAYSVLLFQHLPPDAVKGYINEVRRVLKPGGRFRFQFVHAFTDGTYPGTVEVAPFNWRWNAGCLAEWVGSSGLKVVHWDVGRVFDEWAWITAVKR